MTDSVTVGLTLFMLATLAVGGVGLWAWASLSARKQDRGAPTVRRDVAPPEGASERK